MKQRLYFFLLSVAALGVVTACGGTSSSGGSGLGSASSLTGTVFAPSGTSAVAGATVYIPSTSSDVSVTPTVKAVGNAAADGTTCDDPPVASCASTCSQADGTFSMTVTGCASTASTGNIKKGTFTASFTISCSSTSCAIPTTDTKLVATSTTMAVVTGAYDNIEDALAKIGFGDLNSDNHLKYGTEKFTIYTGGGGRDSELTDTTKYKASSTLFGDITEMKKYNIIFINCGAKDPSTGTLAATVASKALPSTHHVFKGLAAGTISNIQTYVQDGGRIYVTDLAYDFVEQAFPSVMDFEGGSSADSATAESDDAAEIGTSGIAADSTVKDATMKSWLSKQTSNTVSASATTPNSGACTTTANGNSTALNSDGATIRIGDFLPGWAVMNSAYSGSDTKVWLEGPVQFTGSSGTVTRPLTVTKTVGSGKILYSSYHTSHSCPTSGVWPQERVLQYLVFEVAD